MEFTKASLHGLFASAGIDTASRALEAEIHIADKGGFITVRCDMLPDYLVICQALKKRGIPHEECDDYGVITIQKKA